MPTDLQIARFIQDQGYELYGIFDVTDLLKKTFQEQEIISFEKTWFFRDYMKKNFGQKINEKYLIEFEKKYDINLWTLVFKDRNLYYFNDYHTFDHDEILQIVEQTARFFESIIEEINPSYLLIDIPDYFHLELLYELCKSKGIKILTLSSARFAKRWMISENTDILDEKLIFSETIDETNCKSFEELKNLSKDFYKSIAPEEIDLQLSNKTKFKGYFHYIFSVINNDYQKFYFNFGRTRLRILYNESLIILKKYLRSFYINKNLKKQIELNRQFAYFPLQVLPERSTLSASPYYTNQIEVIRNIARSLPINYKLYVKEHPIQLINCWREISFYKEILQIPNVELLHPKFSTDDLLINCSLVVAITGTTAFTAAFYEKPSIIFSDVLFSDLPSVYRVKNIEELPLTIKSALSTKVQNSDLNKVVNHIFKNSFELDFFGIFAPMYKQFFYDGFTTDTYVEKSHLEDFLTTIKPLLKIWSDEYVKKIN